MIPNIINSYAIIEDYQLVPSLWWIVEYSQASLGLNKNEYISSPKRYSLFRNECLSHPTDFISRLNNGVYRIWTIAPYEENW